jgi:competence protein ComQ
MRLLEFLERVDERVDAAVLRPDFDPTQRALLADTVARYRLCHREDPIYDPLSRAVLYFIVRAWDSPIDERVELFATFSSLYFLAADLMDDVEDQDLAGKPHERVGPAVATNDAVTLLFLALEALQRVVEHEPSESRRFACYRVFNRASLAAVAGQHRDLTGQQGISTPRDVLRMYLAKTSSLSMLTECAALLAGCDDAQCARYRRIGECFALLVQIRDDLRDVYATNSSPDLSLGRATYPVACFLEQADDGTRRHFHQLVSALPTTVRDVRELLYEQGAIAVCAEAIEGFRQEIHENVAALTNPCAAHRSILWIVDGLADSVYRTEDIAASLRVVEPDGPWHGQVRHHFELSWARMAGATKMTRPKLRPWHLPQWMYCPDKQTIYYPDIEGLADEVLPFQADLLGIRSLAEVAELMRAQVPAVVAHEMFHFLRHASGRMTSDHWHEEWAANRLTVAYLQRYAPDALAGAAKIATRILSRYPNLLNQGTRRVLRHCREYQPEAPSGYDMNMTTMAVVSLEMIRRLGAERIDLDATISELLEPRPRPSSEVAA